MSHQGKHTDIRGEPSPEENLLLIFFFHCKIYSKEREEKNIHCSLNSHAQPQTENLWGYCQRVEISIIKASSDE